MNVKTAKAYIRMLGFYDAGSRNGCLRIRENDNTRILYYESINMWEISPITDNKPFAVKLVRILNEPTNRKGTP